MFLNRVIINDNMKEELRKIAIEIGEIIKEEGLDISDKDLLDFSVRIYLTESINKNNKLKNEQSPRDFLEQRGNDGLATPNQIAFLKKQGKTIPDKLSKKEAYLLIKNIKEK